MPERPAERMCRVCGKPGRYPWVEGVCNICRPASWPENQPLPPEAKDLTWIDAVSRSDSGTLVVIFDQQEFYAKQYEDWASHYRRRMEVITEELSKRDRAITPAP